MKRLRLFSLMSCLLSLDAFAVCQQELKLMTFNLRYDSGDADSETEIDGWNNLQNPRSMRVKTVVGTWAPDIIGTQEGLQNQIKDLSGAWPAYAFWGVGRDDGKARGEYAGIYYRRDRFQFQNGGHFWLSPTPDQPGTTFPGAGNNRMVSWIRIVDRTDATPYSIVNTHWDNASASSRRASATLMVKRLKTLVPAGDRLIVLGDLNSYADSEEVRTLRNGLELNDGFRLAQPQEGPDEATYHGFEGRAQGRRIDFILTQPGLQVNAAQIIRDSFGGRFPSDHFPVLISVCS